MARSAPRSRLRPWPMPRMCGRAASPARSIASCRARRAEMSEPPAGRPAVVRDVAGLRAPVAGWRRDGATVGLVPTMGALHDGHRALIAASSAAGHRAIVTLFVNPTQFGPHEDFAAYPRDEAADLAIIAEAGAALLFAPPVAAVYPPGFST